MTTWIEIGDEMLSELFTAAELAVVTRDRQSGGVDAIAEVITGVCATIRGRIASGGRTSLTGGKNTIPEELKMCAGALIRFRILSRFALTISDERKADWEEANRTLREISAGTYVIVEKPSDRTPAPYYSGRPARWGMSRRGGVM